MLRVYDLLKEIQKELPEEVGSIYKHKDYIIVGNNMSGKSWLIRELLKVEQQKKYFIDSNNRNIATNNPRGRFNDISNKYEILIERIKKENFNNRDSITSTYNNALILNELFENMSEYKFAINGYFGEEFSVLEVEDTENNPLFTEKIYKYKIGDKTYDQLSNGFQSIIRILVEIVFAVSLGIELVVIDEIDLHLDGQNCKRMIQFLKGNFQKVRWIFTTHSPDVILGSEEFNVFKIDGDSCSYFDGDDMSNIPYINRMLFEPSILTEHPLDNELSDLLRLRTLGVVISEDDINRINSYDKLTIKQQILRKYIIGWNNEN